MSAPPSFRHFQEARARGERAAGKDVSGDSPSSPAWREVDTDAPEDAQGAWSYVRRHDNAQDASEAERYPRAIRLSVIGALSLASWALVLGAGRLLSAALK